MLCTYSKLPRKMPAKQTMISRNFPMSFCKPKKCVKVIGVAKQHNEKQIFLF